MLTALIYIYHIWRVLWPRKYHQQDCQPIVIYESAHFKFVNKPPDMRINSNNASHFTLQTFLLKAYPNQGNPKLTHSFYFVHRLDYATSGIICIPMTKRACKLASEAFQSRRTKKYYLAIVRGILSEPLIVVNHAIGDDLRAEAAVAQRMCTADDKNCAPNARPATTLIAALDDGFYENYPGTKVLIRPITGRRHQIRVHCARLGHTIVGDYTYSNKTDIQPRRMFLHSFRLVLPNDLEFVDLQTDDPFGEAAAAVGAWRLNKRHQTMAEAFTVLEQYANAATAVSKCHNLQPPDLS